ncbi:alpha/beta-hydrolase [Lactifluus subvellereus]|nr:alpha/beta-hydrolase [Lactifluus subvellereus]
MLPTPVLVLLLPLLGFASPLVDRWGKPSSTGTPTPVSAQDISANFMLSAYFSPIAYCSSDVIQAWNCGPSCQAKLYIDNFTPPTIGGDGNEVPLFFVGHDTTTQCIVVAHKGTNTSNILSIVKDVKFSLGHMNPTFFPNAGSDVQVHNGLAETQGRTADAMLSAVKSGLQSTVLVTGHSLGAAIATMDAVMLRQHLDPTVSIRTVVFGLPRGGNAAFANLIGSQLGSQFTYVTHGKDPVPTVPPRFLGYQHSAGEVHIPSSGEAGTVACPGQENVNCNEGGFWRDHLGPYFAGVEMGKSACPL